ncbi:hypothetical protein [Micromonospora siamensis]|uniref:Plasmid replication, integration and excision activator n=1 Tax=Micromonospora siamensis TaxID=299152 RepID=A0A1C5I670_9ACTN|nr:hypothetical protein [Micromonospora siamensis]SCG53655.1 hypothetical protein GA0074704_2970 [Micromonospora siamensis]
MGRLLLDTSRVSYEVSVNPVPKLDQNGQQKFDRETKHPMWTVHLYALSENSGEVINVTVVSPTLPPVTVRQPVVPVDLEALPWVNDRDGKVRSGVAFRASALKALDTAVA